MAWAPETSTDIEQMFASLSVFDVWRSVGFYSPQTGDAHRLADRERKQRDNAPRARANAERAESTAAEVWRLHCDGMSVREIAAAVGKSVGSVHLTISKLRNGGEVKPWGGRRRAA